jgi:hypothetical protein
MYMCLPSFSHKENNPRLKTAPASAISLGSPLPFTSACARPVPLTLTLILAHTLSLSSSVKASRRAGKATGTGTGLPWWRQWWVASRAESGIEV